MTPAPNFCVVYKEVNGSRISTDIYLPDCVEGDSQRPAIIDLHGGAFMLGHRDMVSKAQIEDCLGRGWIVVVPDHRLCPQVNLLEGPMTDVRDLLSWIHAGNLDHSIGESAPEKKITVDLKRILAFGTSSGGHLALSLGWDVRHPVAAIFDLYGACDFNAPFWTQALPQLGKILSLPENLTPEFLAQVYEEDPVPTQGGVSLEGQAKNGHDFSDPRTAFAITQIVKGTVRDVLMPDGDFSRVDPVSNVHSSFPPTIIVHGQDDNQIPIHASRELLRRLKAQGVACEMIEVPGEGHTFAAKMQVGSPTWNLQRQGFDFLERVMQKDV